MASLIVGSPTDDRTQLTCCKGVRLNILIIFGFSHRLNPIVKSCSDHNCYHRR